MNHSKSKETLNFSGFPNYYGYMSYYQGYGGFDFFADFLYMNASTWTNPNGVGYQYGWCDTGYQNVAKMDGATSEGVIYQFGIMESASHHTFNLNSVDAAASFSKNAVWEVVSKIEKGGSLYQKAVDFLKVSYTGKHVDFTKLGNPDDFKNIAAVYFYLSNYGKAGDICTYGYPVVGAQLVLGNVNVTVSKKAHSESGGRLPMPHLLHQLYGVPHVTAERAGHVADGGSAHNHSSPHQYHQDSAGHDPGINPQFHLPAVDHFF